MEFPAAYVRRIVTTTFLAERRRWSTRHIRPFAAVPEPAAADPTSSVDDRSALHTLLAGLPRQQRAAIVLRFYLDLTDDEIAAELRCSAGAVRGYISRGLATLRVVVTEADAPVLRPRAGTAAPDTNPGRRP
jgi:RNA polymerase sigma factor (sigma-70 family)